MWILINTVQFIVYMSLWQINFPQLLRIFFIELKRIVLAEFFDDLPIGEWIADLFRTSGFSEEPSSPEQQVGEERLGSKSPGSSLGVTFLIITFVFVILILIIGLIVLICRLTQFSDKNIERFENIKKAIFFNSMIRYSFLSANKLNMAAMLGLKGFSETPHGSNIVSICVLIVISTLPFLYAKLMHKNALTLETDKKMEKTKSLF